MKPKSQPHQFKDTYECHDCGFAGSTKRAKKFKVQKGGESSNEDYVITLCPNCYRLRTNPNCDDILRKIIELKEMICVRHDKLWYQQIKEDHKNVSERGTPATATLYLIKEQIGVIITTLLVHADITRKPKKSKKSSKSK